MDLSKYLSKVIGLYLVIVSTAMFINMAEFIAYFNNVINDTTLLFVAGFFTLFLGLLLVVSHNKWQWNWRIIVTLFCWITLLKGASIIFYPQFIDNLTLLFAQNITVAYLAAGIDFVLGVLLCYFGFKR